MKTIKSISLIIIIILVFTCTGYAGLQDNGDHTITDTETGLMWMKNTAPGGEMSWEAALIYCEESIVAGYDDWRLPTIKELGSIVDYSTRNPAINTQYFPDTEPSYYWTSTTYAFYTNNAWVVFFQSGFNQFRVKTLINYVRAVRLGESD